MKIKILVTFLVVTVLAGCSKDKYTTKPQLTFKSVNTTLLQPNQSIQFIIEVTDREGDIQDSIWIQKFEPNCPSSNFIAKYKMPDFNKLRNLKGDIEICFGYGIGLGCAPITGPFCPNRNDTAVFKFWLQDNAKNMSDTISSPSIVITR